MNLKIHPLLGAAVILGICLLIFTLIKGCNNAESDKEVISLLEEKNALLDKKNQALELASLQSKKDFQDSLEFVNDQLSLKEAQKEATEEKLDAANTRINDLLKRYTPVVPSDTGTTMVPNDYIADCSDCFGELGREQKLVNQYRKEIDEKDAFADKITVIYNKRIDQLEHEKQQSNKLANDYKEVAQMAIKKADPRRIVYLSLAGITINSILPNGVGGGLKYQDKKKRIFGVKVIGSNVGTIYEGELSLPLSFRRK